jgi:uncharacterized Zn finger protein
MAYFQGGAVGLLDADEFEARASVQGTHRYRVRVAAALDGGWNTSAIARSVTMEPSAST